MISNETVIFDPDWEYKDEIDLLINKFGLTKVDVAFILSIESYPKNLKVGTEVKLARLINFLLKERKEK